MKSKTLYRFSLSCFGFLDSFVFCIFQITCSGAHSYLPGMWLITSLLITLTNKRRDVKTHFDNMASYVYLLQLNWKWGLNWWIYSNNRLPWQPWPQRQISAFIMASSVWRPGRLWDRQGVLKSWNITSLATGLCNFLSSDSRARGNKLGRIWRADRQRFIPGSSDVYIHL